MEEKEWRRARVALIRPSASLSPSSCTVPVEYRLSVVRLGVLRPSKYLGIFEELRVPKKTVYFVGKEGSIPGERDGTRRDCNSFLLEFSFLSLSFSLCDQTRRNRIRRVCKKKEEEEKKKTWRKRQKHETELHFGITEPLSLG